MNEREYLVFGITIEKLCLLYGLILIIFGIVISYASSSSSLTSYIPSFLGIPLAVSSYLSIIDLNRKKLYAHISVFIILIAFLGGLDFLRSIGSPFENFWPDLSKLFLLFSGMLMLNYCIKSFIYVRKHQ